MTIRNPNLPGVTAAQHDFAKIPGGSIPRSLMQRNHGHKTTFNFGEIVPIFTDEVVPGDTMTLTPTIVARVNTQLRPLMDNMYVDLHFFAVPHRIVYDNWERLCGAQDNPGDSTDYQVPILAPTTNSPAQGFGTVVAWNGLYDHLGVPPQVAHDEITNLWGRAVNSIWNEWYRDENLQDSLTVDKGDGPDQVADYDNVLKRGKRHDYFTSCLPTPQKGPTVELPIGGTAPLTLSGLLAAEETGLPTFQIDGAPASGRELRTDPGSGKEIVYEGTNLGQNKPVSWGDPNLQIDLSGGGGTADLSSATATTINELRNAIAVQQVYEKDMRGGTRYRELLLAHYGTTLDDGRAQIPEFLGGTTCQVTIEGVVQTSGYGTGIHQQQGDLAGIAFTSKQGRGFTKTFTEHAMIIGFASARADLNYQQGLHKQFSRRDRFDFYYPDFANLGEEAVLNKEIYAVGGATPGQDSGVFGYQERYAAYRYSPSLITGRFRSTQPNNIDIWHLAQDFSALPALGASFIEENPPIDRVVADTTEPELLLDCFFEYKCARPMPLFGVPGLKRL